MVEKEKKMRAIFIFIISLYFTGCTGGASDSDTGDTATTYNQSARVRNEVGWRPVSF
jgi:hypothetical protein